MVTFINTHKQLIQAVGFWVLLVFLTGFACGLLVSKGIWEYKSGEVTKVGSVLIDGRVYDVKLKP